MATTKGGVLLKQTLLDVETEVLGLVIQQTFALLFRELVDLTVGIEHVEQGLSLHFRHLGNQLSWPHLFHLEALGELHQLPQVGLGPFRCLHLLVPELGAALCVAVGPLFLHPHGGGQDEVSGLGGNSRVRVRDHDEVARVAIARQAIGIHVGAGLHVVVAHHPVGVELAILEHAILQHGVVTHLLRNGAFRQFPDLLGDGAMLGIGHHHVGWQTVGKGAYFPRGTARRRLASQGEGARARLGDLAGQQVDVVAEVVGPDTASMLVETHGPVRDHLLARISIELGQFFQLLFGDAGELGDRLHIVVGHELGKFFEGHRSGIATVRVLRFLLQRVGRTQTITDVGGTFLEHGVLVDEVPVHLVVLNDVVGDIVEDRQIGLGREDDAVIRQFEAAVLESGEHVHLHIRVGEAAIGHPRPEDGVHLGHVGAPQHEGIGLLDIVIAAHRLVHAEGTHKADDRGGHAVASIGIDVVGTETCLHQLGGGVTFPDGPLAGTEHANGCRPLLFQGGLELLGHDVEGLIPADGCEVAILVELAVLHPQHGLGEAILTVHDLGEEVALDAVEATVDRRIGVALSRHDTAILGTDQHGAAGTAEAARRFIPVDGSLVGTGDEIGRQGGGTDTGHSSGSRHRVGLHKVASTQLHDISSHCLSRKLSSVFNWRSLKATNRIPVPRFYRIN